MSSTDHSVRFSHNPGRTRMVGPWSVGRTIGKGSSGHVRIARHDDTGQYAAVKIVSKHALLSSRMANMANAAEEEDRILHAIEREIVIMKLIDHPNVLALYDVWETKRELYLVMEYLPKGELFDYLVARGRLPVSEAVHYFQQIINAVHTCHSYKIAHRDLKPENLLLDADLNVKVADFGMAIFESGENLLQTSCGSPHYASPEICNGEEYSGFVTDVWSCGVILYTLLTGRLPFDDDNLALLLEQVKRARFEMPRDLEPAAADLLRRMLEKNPERRITIDEILRHPFYLSRPQRLTQSRGISGLALEDLNPSLLSINDIDPHIFRNLQILWTHLKDEEVVDRLLCNERTPEKGIYHLLLRYREKETERENGTQSPPCDSEMGDTTYSRSCRTSSEDSESRVRLDTIGVPAIAVQAATPTKSTASRRTSGGQRIPDNPHKPSISTSDPIQVPDVENEAVQHFFLQIAERLNAMQLTQSPDSQAFADAARRFGPGLNNATAFRSALTAGPPPPTPSEGNFDFDQSFSEDGSQDGLHADISESDYATFSVGSTLTPRRPNLHHHASAPSQSSKARHDRPAPFRVHSEPNPMYKRDKENEWIDIGEDYVPSARPQAGPVLKATTNQTLQPRSSIRSDGSNRAPLSEKHVQILLPEDDWLEKRRLKRQSVQDDQSGCPNPPSAPNSAFLPFSSSDSGAERKSWFSNVFSLKPASYSLLSAYDHVTTRSECRKLLQSFGIIIHMQNSEANNGGTLRCRLDEVRDPAGVMSVVKAVRFHVALRQPSPSHSAAGYLTSLDLVMDKGSSSSFKLIFNRLRREWEFDVPSGLPRIDRRKDQPGCSHEHPTLRLVPTREGSFVGSDGGLPSPALSAGGHYMEPVYRSAFY